MAVKKIKLTLLLQTIIVLLLFAISFKGKTLLCDYTYEDVIWDGEYHTIAVPFYHTGIYQVEIEVNKSCGEVISFDICSLEDKGFLLQNTVSIQPGQGDANYYVWSYQEKMADVVIHANQDSISSLIAIRIYSTAVLFRAIALIMLICFIVFDAIYLLIKERKAKDLYVVAALIVIAIIAFLPYISGYMYIGADTLFHLLRIQGLYKTLQEHFQIPVLIQTYQNYGHGSIAPMFYSDFFLYIPVLFLYCGFTIQTAYKAYLLFVIILGNTIAFYSLYKVTGSRIASIVGTGIITLSPYHLFNFYNRGAVGEYTAMVFIPLVILGFWFLLAKDVSDKEYGKCKMWIALGMSGIIQSHLLTAEMVAGVLLLVCICEIKRLTRKETAFQLTLAVIFSFILNCRFLSILLSTLVGDSYNLSVVFGENIQAWGTSIRELCDMHFQARPMFLMGLFALIWLIYVIVASEKRVCDKSITSFALLTLLTILLGTNVFPWDNLAKIKLLGVMVKSIQYPGRFYSLCVCLCGFFVALFLSSFVLPCRKVVYHFAIFVFSFTAFTESLVYCKELYNVFSPIKIYTAENFGTSNIWNRNWLPIGLEVSDISFHGPTVGEGIIIRGISSEGTKIVASVVNDTPKEEYFEYPITAYRGYYALGKDTHADKMQKLEITRGGHFDLRVVIPAYFDGEVVVAFGYSVINNVLLGIECFFIIVSIGIYISGERKKKSLV